jgi:hypothetical protein
MSTGGRDARSDEPAGSDRRARILMLLESGVLPRVSPERVWAGPGRGQPCLVCLRPIPANDFEFEIPGPKTALLDRRCFDAFMEAISGR